MSPGERALRADAQRNREKVLRAAREAFAAGGYGVPLDEIAALAGVGPGTVYRHFPSKEALFEAVVDARVRDLVDDARQRAGASDPGAAFFGFLAVMGGEAAAKRDLPDAIAVDGEVQRSLLAAFGELLQRAQRAGAVRPDVTMPDLIVLLKGLMHSLQDVPPGPAGAAQRDRVIAVVMDGLRQAKPPGWPDGPPGGNGRLLVRATRAQLDPGEDEDGRQQDPGGKQDVDDGAEKGHGQDGGDDEEDEGDDGGHDDLVSGCVRLLRS